MILNDEQIAQLDRVVSAGTIKRDLLDTIADLQRQLAAYKALTHQTKDRTKLDAYVQEKVDRAVLDYRKRVFELLDMHRTQRAYSWHEIEDALSAANRAKVNP